ncbi:MAG: peptide ABC transporter substrate-binding protein [Chloroflexi bacterium]|nr:peptide ABC transporter substrate-binding protein [Chloroflexota bacterium]
MLHKRLILVFGLVLIASMVLAACAPKPPAITTPTAAPPAATEAPTEAPPPPEEKTLIVCQGQEPDTLYIYGGAMLASSHVQNAVYDGPIDNRSFGYQAIILQKLPSLADGDAVINAVTVKEGDKVINDAGDIVTLAVGEKIRPAGCRSSECAVEYAGGEVQMDQMAVTFKMLEGLKWSDGESLTAADSVYSFEVYMDPDTPTPSRYAGEHTTSYVATDDLTTVWTGLPGYLDATYFVNFWSPLPEHQLGEMTAAEIVESPEASRTPLGWGPFIITEWVAGSHITTVKNPNYFRAAEGLPKVDKLIFRFVGEEPNPAIAAVVAGECDILTQDTHLDDQSELLIELEKTGALVPTFVTGTVWEHVDFGINPVETYDRPDFFEDLRVRQAVAMCLDRQAVVDSVMLGRSKIMHSYIPEEHPMYNPDVKQWPFDVEAGKALLEEVGWKDEDGDGFREAHGVADITDGTKLAFMWQSTTAELRVKYMQIFKEQLAACGIDLTIENLPAGQYFADGPEGPVFGRQFDLGSFAWLTGVEPPCSLYLSSEIPSEATGWAGQNDPGFSDAEYDIACNAAIQSLPGTPEYEQYHKQAQLLFSEKLPVVPLFLRTKLAAYRPEVVGFIMDPTANSEMWNIENFGFAP